MLSSVLDGSVASERDIHLNATLKLDHERFAIILRRDGDTLYFPADVVGLESINHQVYHPNRQIKFRHALSIHLASQPLIIRTPSPPP